MKLDQEKVEVPSEETKKTSKSREDRRTSRSCRQAHGISLLGIPPDTDLTSGGSANHGSGGVLGHESEL